jgi:hypothetical protein
MERVRKLQLVERSLGIRHKLKVFESMKTPETHEDLAVTLLAKWELEDELRAIEELLAEGRLKNVAAKKKVVAGEDGVPPAEPKKKKK